MIKTWRKVFAILILIFLIGPANGQSTVSYDKVISKIVNKIQQYPKQTRQLGELKENYALAVATDSEHIRHLQSTGQPDIWPEIYGVYKKMDNRQQHLQTLPAKTLTEAGFEFQDLSGRLAESKYKACAYLYAHAQKLLSTGKATDARAAYNELIILARIDGGYREIDKLIRKSILLGASKIEFELQNRTNKYISNSLVDELSRIVSSYKTARQGVSAPQDGAIDDFKFTIRVVLNDLTIGPDQVRELEYGEERDIYRGDQVVDTIRCSVREYRQLKKAELVGALEFYDHQAAQVINRVPLRVESVFSNAYAYLQGDSQAAGEETRALLSSKKAEYPSEDKMVIDAAREFARQASEVILTE